MWSLYFLLSVACAVNSILAANNGAVTILVGGERKTKYVLSTDWSKQFIRVNKSTITLHGGGRAYLGDSPDDAFTVDSFYQMPLLGKRLLFDVDMSEVGCNCNGALYILAMPAYNSDQKPVPGKDGDYYCDADKVGGTYCQDMDVMEANKFAMASTAHTCDLVAPHYYPDCDRKGCGMNVLDINFNGYGPGKMPINTNKLFTLSVAFVKDKDGELAKISNSFIQDGCSLHFSSCNDTAYLHKLGKSLPGMVMTMSLWGTGEGGMSWLDGKSGCHGACDVKNSQVTFTDIRLEDL